MGGNNLIFASVGGPAFCSDLDQGRRPGKYSELCDYLKLVQSLNILIASAIGLAHVLNVEQHDIVYPS